MDIENLLKAIVKAGQSLADAWLLKMVMALVVSTITSVHGSALIAFATLVFIDLLTRWIALCYTHLKDCGMENDLLSCILDIQRRLRRGISIAMP